MIKVNPWMQQAVALLRAQFGARLLFVGLQGSYRRGEAREESDIDILTILDRVDVADLQRYRVLLHQLPEGEKAGGFTCGQQELLAWPPFELFQFVQDTDAYYGELQPLLPTITRADTITGARAGVSGLYHYCAYLCLSAADADRAEGLKGLYKSFFFSMQLVEYLRHGVYVSSKKALLERLSGDEAELLRLSMDAAYFEERCRREPEALFQLLLGWCGAVLRELARG